MFIIYLPSRETNNKLILLKTTILEYVIDKLEPNLLLVNLFLYPRQVYIDYRLFEV